MSLPELLTTKEAAKILRTTESTLRTWRARKKHQEIKFVKIGGKVLYPKEELFNLIKSRD